MREADRRRRPKDPEARRLARHHLQVHRLSVEQKQPEFPVVRNARQVVPQNPTPRYEVELGARVADLEVRLDVADQVALAADARVADARAQPLPVVEQTQQVDQLGL